MNLIYILTAVMIILSAITKGRVVVIDALMFICVLFCLHEIFRKKVKDEVKNVKRQRIRRRRKED